MNLSGKGALASDEKLPALKSTFLNPNAAEFVPYALRSPATNSKTTELSPGLVPSPNPVSGKAVLDRSESSVTNNSDDEAQQYWQHQLPDDITPDFTLMGEDDSQLFENFSFSSLSFSNVNKISRLPVSRESGIVTKGQKGLSPHHINRNSLAEKTRYPVSSYGRDPSAATFQHLQTKSWDQKFVNDDQLHANGRERSQYDGKLRHGFVADILNAEPYSDHARTNLLQFLASQFAGFSAESLAEVYYANGGNLDLTIEMLTKLELQLYGDLNQSLSSKSLPASGLGAADFPALSAVDGQTGVAKTSIGGLQHNVYSYCPNKDGMLQFKSSCSLPAEGVTDFASAVRKIAQQDSAMWKYDGNGSPNTNVGTGRNPHGLASSYSSGHDRQLFGDRTKPRGSSRPDPVWLETGQAVANMYSEMREEARDHACLRNPYFEQARQAYLIGNKALAKELSVKGQLHNIQMKAAHGKAQESIFHQRNPVSPVTPTNGRGKERILDLHGLHVSEAIHVLKRELAVLRNAARLADQRLQAYICVGTGHHTKGSYTSARLPTAVQRYLLEEGLHYSEPQPGLLRVVIY